MSKADLGKIYKEILYKNGIIYFSEMMSSMFLILVETKDHQIIFSRTYPFTDKTKTQQRKLARSMLSTIRYKLINNEDLEIE